MASQVLDIIIKAKNEASAELDAVGGKLDGMKTQLAAVGAAGLAVGVLAVKGFVDFDREMVKLQTQVGLSAAEVEDLTEVVKGISGATAIGPAELAEALFTIESAGLRGEAAVSLLDSAAKGAAVGFGTAKDIATLLTATINSFGAENISASQAMDILAQTVESGNFNANELASSLGKVLPVSAAMGVSFEETGAFIATFTKSGATASEAVNAMKATLLAIQKPTKDAEIALAAVGLTTEDLQAAVSADGVGLSAALIDLRQRLDEQGIGLSEVIGSSEGLVAALFNTGAQADAYTEANEAMNTSLGKAANAFDIVKTSAGFEFDEAWNNLQLVLLDIGTQIIPMLMPLVDVIADAVGWVTELDPGLQKVIVAFGAVGTAVALLAVAFGPLIVAATAAGVAMTAATLGIPLAIAAIIAGIALLIVHWDEVTEFFQENAKWIALAIAPISLPIAAVVVAIGLLKDGWREAANDIIGVAETMVEGVVTPLNFMIDNLNRIPGVDIEPIAVQFERLHIAVEANKDALTLTQAELTAVADEGVIAFEQVERETKIANNATENLNVALGQTQAELRATANTAQTAGRNITVAINDTEHAVFRFRDAEFEAQLASTAKWDAINAAAQEYNLKHQEIEGNFAAEAILLESMLATQILLNAAIPDIGSGGDEGTGGGPGEHTETEGTTSGVADGTFSSDGTLRSWNGIWFSLADYDSVSTGGGGGTTDPAPAPEPEPEPDPAPGGTSYSPPGSSWTGTSPGAFTESDLHAIVAAADYSPTTASLKAWEWVSADSIRNADSGGRITVGGTYHTGGIVPGRPGQEQLALLQAGETVLPTQRGGAMEGMGMGMGGDITIVINNNGPVGVADLAEQVNIAMARSTEQGFV